MSDICQQRQTAPEVGACESVVNEPKRQSNIRIDVNLIDKLYVLRGRRGTYSHVIEGILHKATEFDSLNEKYEALLKESVAKGNILRGRVTKLKNLISKHGGPELKKLMDDTMTEE